MRDALMVALNREAKGADGKKTKRLYIIADQLVEKACGGDVQAIREVADRVDGKPPQAITSPDGDAMPVLGVVMVPAKSGG